MHGNKTKTIPFKAPQTYKNYSVNILTKIAQKNHYFVFTLTSALLAKFKENWLPKRRFENL